MANIKYSNGKRFKETTGEIYTEAETIKEQSESIKNAYKEYSKSNLESNTEPEYRLIKIIDKEYDKKKVKERYAFNMMHRTDLKEIMLSGELSANELAFIGALTPFISYPNNDVKINQQYYTLEEIGKFIGRSRNMVTKIINTLEKMEIIKVIKGHKLPPVIYFNPFLYSSGREISKDTYMLFCQSMYNPDKLHYIN